MASKDLEQNPSLLIYQVLKRIFITEKILIQYFKIKLFISGRNGYNSVKSGSDLKFFHKHAMRL